MLGTRATSLAGRAIGACMACTPVAAALVVACWGGHAGGSVPRTYLLCGAACGPYVQSLYAPCTRALVRRTSTLLKVGSTILSCARDVFGFCRRGPLLCVVFCPEGGQSLHEESGWLGYVSAKSSLLWSACSVNVTVQCSLTCCIRHMQGVPLRTQKNPVARSGAQAYK